jgi:hypothetical protein
MNELSISNKNTLSNPNQLRTDGLDLNDVKNKEKEIIPRNTDQSS